MKRSLFFKIFSRLIFVLVCLVTLLALVFAEENFRGKRAWDQCKRDFEARGEYLDGAHFIPPPVTDDRNFALNPLFKSYFYDPATGKLDDHSRSQPLDKLRLYAGYSQKVPSPGHKNGGWQTGNPRDIETWQAYYRASLPDMPPSKSPEEDIVGVIGRLEPIFTELRKDIVAMPLSRFPIAYEKGPGAALPHYAPFQELVNILSLRATALLRLNRAQEAYEDVQLGFLLSKSTSADPILIGGLVRVSCTSILIGPIWEGIAAHRWSDDQLAGFQAALRQIDYLSEYTRSIRMERTNIDLIIGMILKDPLILVAHNAGALPGPEKVLMPSLRFLPGWMYQNAVNETRWFQENLDAVDVKSRRIDLQQLALRYEKLKNVKNLPWTFWAKLVVAPCVGTLPKFASTQTYVNETLIACAIERYRLAHGTLPEKLDDLHMADLPHDIINGEPLHYRLTGDDNYILYSVGWNGRDDGGKIARKSNGGIDLTQGDWVWSLKPL